MSNILMDEKAWQDSRWRTRKSWCKEECPVFFPEDFNPRFGGEPAQYNAFSYAARKYASNINNFRVLCNIKHRDVVRGANINPSDYYRLYSGILDPVNSSGKLRPAARRLCSFFKTTPQKLWPWFYGGVPKEQLEPLDAGSIDDIPESYPYVSEEVLGDMPDRDKVIMLIKNAGLDAQERFVIYRKYVLGQKYHTIAERLGRATSRIAQIHGSAMTKLRRYVLSDSADNAAQAERRKAFALPYSVSVGKPRIPGATPEPVTPPKRIPLRERRQSLEQRKKRAEQYVPVLENYLKAHGIVAGATVRCETMKGLFLGCSVDDHGRLCVCVVQKLGRVCQITSPKVMATLRVLKA